MPPEEDWGAAIGNMNKKCGEDRACSSDDMTTDRHTNTDEHTHHNTPLPYRGRSNKPYHNYLVYRNTN